MTHRSRPEPAISPYQRMSGLVQLERPHNPAPVVRVDPLGGNRIAVFEERVCSLGSELVVSVLPALARTGLGRRRQFDLGQRSSKVEPGAPDDDRGAGGGKDLVYRCVRQLGVLAH